MSLKGLIQSKKYRYLIIRVVIEIAKYGNIISKTFKFPNNFITCNYLQYEIVGVKCHFQRHNDSFSNCGCGATEQTADHIITKCPTL